MKIIVFILLGLLSSPFLRAQCLEVQLNDTVDCDGNLNIIIINCSNNPVYMSYNNFDYFQIGKGVFDNEHNFYNSVVIDQTEWMAENLKTSVYLNGDEIPQFSGSSGWSSLSSGAWDYYSSDVANDQMYGKLYNWYAVSDNQGICPIGWEVAQISDWVNLSNVAGGNLNSGGMLKQKGTQNWNLPNTGALDAYGFEALPGGGKNGSGYWQEGDYAFFWTGTSGSGSNYAQYAMLNNETSELWMADHVKTHGMSVRCINSNTTQIWDTLTIKQKFEGNTTYYFQNEFNGDFVELNIDENDLIFSQSPSINAGSDVNICLGDSALLNPSGSIGYEWSNGNTTAHYVSPLVNSTYGVQGVNQFGCESFDDVSIWLYQLPVVNAGSDQFLCFGDSLLLQGDGSNTIEIYTWNNGAFDDDAFVIPSIGLNQYILLGTDDNLCSNTDTCICYVLDPEDVQDSLIFISTTGAYTLNNVIYTESGTYEQVLQNQYGCDSTIIINLNIEDSGVEDLSECGISLYPNPFSSILHLDFEQLMPEQRLVLTDINGKVLLQCNNLQLNNVIQLNDLESGMYYLNLFQKNRPMGQLKLMKL